MENHDFLVQIGVLLSIAGDVRMRRLKSASAALARWTRFRWKRRSERCSSAADCRLR